MKHLHFSLKKQTNKKAPKQIEQQWQSIHVFLVFTIVSNICTQKKNSGGDTDPCGLFVYGSKYLLNVKKGPCLSGGKVATKESLYLCPVTDFQNVKGIWLWRKKLRLIKISLCLY